MKALLCYIGVLCIASLAVGQQHARKELPIIADHVVDVAKEMFTSTKQKRNVLANGDDLWITFDGEVGCNGPVYVIEPTEEEPLVWEGKGYIGGAFDSLDGKLVRGIGKVNGFEEHTEVGGGVSGGAVYAICEYSANLFVAGNFKQAGGKAVQNIARWFDDEWHPLGSGTDSTVLALCVVNDMLYVGGNFTHAGGAPANYIAIYDIINEEWKPIVVGGVNGMDGGVATLATDGSTFLYAGGGFTKAGSMTVNKIAAFSNNEWFNIGGVEGTNAYVAVIEHGDKLYVGGSFAKAGTVDANNIAELNLTTSTWQPVKDGFDGPVYAIIPPQESDGYTPYVVCGEFTHSGSIELKNIAVRDFSTRWEAWGSGLEGPGYALQANEYVFVAFQSLSNMVLVGGAFTKAGNKPSSNFAIHYEPSKDVNTGDREDIVFSVFPNHLTENEARVDLTLSQPQQVHLYIGDALGREVITLSRNEVVTAEQYLVDGSNLPTGLYYCVLCTPSRQEMRKLLISH